MKYVATPLAFFIAIMLCATLAAAGKPLDYSQFRDQVVDQAAYKQLVEARIANNDGSTFAEVFCVATVLLSTTTVASAITSLLGLARGSLVAVAIEILFCGGAVVVAVTAPTSEESFTRATYFGVMMAVSLVYHRFLKSEPKAKVKTTAKTSNKKSFFSDFRGSLMLLTVVSILAVDFIIFPNRHMKTETYGVSLMDTGVGCFVFSAGFALGGKLLNSKQGQRFSSQWLASSIPLACIGGVRMAIIFYTDYQEHLTEYGKHWNFFCTLAVMPVLYVVLNTITGLFAKPTSILCNNGVQAVLLAGAYQAALTYGGLTEYVDSPFRRSLIEANKEGICSSVGYVAIFLGALELGKFMLKSGNSSDAKTALTALVLDCVLWAATVAADTSIQPCSRRLCNLTYVLFTLALCLFFVASFMLIEAITKSSGRGTYILEAINRNQLFIFLGANLSTGAVNLSMRTIFATEAVGYMVVGGYITWVCTIAVVLHKLDLTLKAW